MSERIWIENPSELWSDGQWKKIVPGPRKTTTENYNAATRLMMVTGAGVYLASGNTNVLYAISVILMVLMLSANRKVKELLPVKKEEVQQMPEGAEILVEQELFPGANAIAERLVTNPREQDQFRFKESTPTVSQYKLGRRPVQDQDQEFADLFNTGTHYTDKYYMPNVRPRLFEPFLQEQRSRMNQ